MNKMDDWGRHDDPYWGRGRYDPSHYEIALIMNAYHDSKEYTKTGPHLCIRCGALAWHEFCLDCNGGYNKWKREKHGIGLATILLYRESQYLRKQFLEFTPTEPEDEE